MHAAPKAVRTHQNNILPNLPMSPKPLLPREVSRIAQAGPRGKEKWPILVHGSNPGRTSESDGSRERFESYQREPAAEAVYAGW